MSGWDTSSRPSWGPQDGPEDGTQTFSAPDFPPKDFSGDSDERQPNGFPEESASAGPPSEFFGQDFKPQEFQKRQPGATLGRSDVPGRDVPSSDVSVWDRNGRGKHSAGPGAPPWQDPSRSEPAAWPEPTRSEPAAAWPEPTRSEPAWPDNGHQDYGRQDPAVPDLPARSAGRADYPAQPAQPAAPDPTQQSPVAALSPDRLDQEHAARLDPALQDFFGPGGARTDAPQRAPGIRAPLPPGPQGPGLPPAGQQRYSGNSRGEQPRYNGSNGKNGTGGSPWDNPAKHPRTGPLAAALTGPMLAVKGAAALVTPKENEPLRIRVLRYFGVTVVVVVAVVAGVYLLTHDTGTSVNATGTQADPQPIAVGQSVPAATPTASSKAKSTGKSKAKSGTSAAKSTTDYVLATPATAGGYPMGQDPEFLATGTATAQNILSTVSAAGGGKATGSAVSAPYRLPNSQVVTYVGYHGTFTPSKVISSLGSYGTTDGTYNDAKAGDSIACANTVASGTTPSGAVCVWATSTTIGVTEFFDETGPEALTSSQYKGAAIAEQVRASVETKKS